MSYDLCVCSTLSTVYVTEFYLDPQASFFSFYGWLARYSQRYLAKPENLRQILLAKI